MRAAAAEAAATNKQIDRTARIVNSHPFLRMLVFFQAIAPVVKGCCRVRRERWREGPRCHAEVRGLAGGRFCTALRFIFHGEGFVGHARSQHQRRGKKSIPRVSSLP